MTLGKWTLEALKDLVEGVSNKLWDQGKHPDGNGGEDEELFPMVLEALAVKLAADWDQIYGEGELPPTLDIATVLKASEQGVLVLVPSDEMELEPEELVEEWGLLRELFGDGRRMMVLPRGTQVHQVRNQGGLTVIINDGLEPEDVNRMTDHLNTLGIEGVLVANHKVGIEEIPAEDLEAAGWVRKERSQE